MKYRLLVFFWVTTLLTVQGHFRCFSRGVTRHWFAIISDPSVLCPSSSTSGISIDLWETVGMLTEISTLNFPLNDYKLRKDTFFFTFKIHCASLIQCIYTHNLHMCSTYLQLNNALVLIRLPHVVNGMNFKQGELYLRLNRWIMWAQKGWLAIDLQSQIIHGTCVLLKM